MRVRPRTAGAVGIISRVTKADGTILGNRPDFFGGE